jgi:hypothetical protein
MSKKLEQKFWARLRPKLVAGGLHCERIENAVGSGRPDVDGLWEGRTWPIELKAVADWPKRATTPVLGKKGLRLSQRNWFLNYHRNSGHGIIVVAVGLETFAFDGAVADDLNSFNAAQFKAEAIANTPQGIIQFIKENTP